MILDKDLLIVIQIFETIFATFANFIWHIYRLFNGYLINIVDSTLVYRLHSCDISYRYFCRIYNDITNYCCCAKCHHAIVCVYAIVTVAAPLKT